MMNPPPAATGVWTRLSSAKSTVLSLPVAATPRQSVREVGAGKDYQHEQGRFGSWDVSNVKVDYCGLLCDKWMDEDIAKKD